MVSGVRVTWPSHGRALGLYANLLDAAVPGQRGRRTAETGILYAQAAVRPVPVVPVVGSGPGLLQARPQRAADRRRHGRPVGTQRGRHRHRAAVRVVVVARGRQVRFAAGVGHRHSAASYTHDT